MATRLQDFDQFDRLLQEVMPVVADLAREAPGDRGLQSVHLQLQALHGWTRGGRCPDQSEKDRLTFGQIASRELSDLGYEDLCGWLYSLASYVTWWGEPGQGQD